MNTGAHRILLTGSGSGIGLATAVKLASAGYRVVGVVRGDEERDVLVQATARLTGSVEVVVADLAEPASRPAIAGRGPFWAVINTAGFLNAGRLEDVTIDDARRQLEAMVVAPVDLVKHCLPSMRSAGAGRIVNVTSSAAHTSTPLSGWYAANKAALRELNDALRLELEGSGIATIDVEPGGIQTNIWSRAAVELRERRPGSGPARDLYDSVLANLDRGYQKMGHPEEVADAILDVLRDPSPPNHVRVGPGAGPLRLINDLVPDKVWDKVVHAVTRRAAKRSPQQTGQR